MPATASPRDTSIHAAAITIAAAVFMLDRSVPTAGFSMLYTLVALLGLWTRWPPYPRVAVTGSALLIWTAAWLAPLGLTAPGATEAALETALCAATAFAAAKTLGLQRDSAGHVEQLTQLKEALDHAAIVATTDVRGRITFVNDKFCEISGYSRDELLGQDHRIINSGGHPKAFMRDLWQTIAQGKVWRGEIRNRAKNGHFYWVETTIVPFVGAHGKPYQYIAIRADVTARKAAEEKLAQQSALAQVGQLAAVVAHEVRNPLAGIKGAVQILMSRRPSGDSELQVMQDIVERIDALSELINDLMLFARPRPPMLRPTDLTHLVREALTMVRRDPPGAVVEMATGEPLTLTCDGNLVRAAVLNVALNAVQAAGPTGRVSVRVTRAQDQALVEVRDNGPGIPPDVREHVFEPFFTTKARGGGLGLSTARRTAEIHGGTLTLDSPPGGGTIALFRFPIRPTSDGALVA